jgi:hypothetical protein
MLEDYVKKNNLGGDFMEYIMCLENGNYKVELNSIVAINELESMIDSLIDLCQSYNIDPEDIVETLKSDTCLEINSME